MLNCKPFATEPEDYRPWQDFQQVWEGSIRVEKLKPGHASRWTCMLDCEVVDEITAQLFARMGSDTAASHRTAYALLSILTINTCHPLESTRMELPTNTLNNLPTISAPRQPDSCHRRGVSTQETPSGNS